MAEDAPDLTEDIADQAPDDEAEEDNDPGEGSPEGSPEPSDAEDLLEDSSGLRPAHRISPALPACGSDHIDSELRS